FKSDAIRGGERAGEIIYIPVTRPYTEVGFCAFHNLGEKYLSELSNTLAKHEDSEAKQLSNILTRARAKCYEQKYSGAAAGVYNANIIARTLGLVDKTESKVTVEQPLFSDEDKD
ncbi:MAG: terminase small subunit, partial [Sphingobacterium sp.]